MTTNFSYVFLYLVCLATTIAESKIYYIRPSQSAPTCSEPYVIECDSHLTLSQFVSNSSDYLVNDTTLIFAPGNHSLESLILVENVHSFSMFVESTSSSRAVIICGHNAKFEVKNSSRLTMNGFDFVGCFGNHIASVGHIQLENSKFYGNGQTEVYQSTTLIIDKSTANLNRVDFISIAGNKQQNDIVFIDSPKYYTDRAICILSTRSIIVIAQSWFEGNYVGPDAVIYSENDSDIIIFSTTFVNNSAATYCYTESNYTRCKVGSILDVKDGNLKIHDSKFEHNYGVLFPSGDNNNVSYYYFNKIVYATDSNLIISHSTFTNNTGLVLHTWNTITSISQSEFVDNDEVLAIYYGTIISIDHCKFMSNTGLVLYTISTNTSISQSEFVDNDEVLVIYYGTIISIDHCKFMGNTGLVLYTMSTNTSISQSEFISNNVVLITNSGEFASIEHSKFINNTGTLFFFHMNTISIDHSEFVDNNARGTVYFDGNMITMSFNEFINNRAEDYGLVYISIHITPEKITNNVYINNTAPFDLYIDSDCRSRQGFGLSLGSSYCVKCPKEWRRNIAVIVIVGFVAGIALVILMLTLNMTVAVGTLNGILFYANIIAASSDTYFLPFTSPSFITVFISWLNLDIGFNVCFYEGMNIVTKALIQLAFPAYIIVLVIIVIVASECSSKFAKIIGKGNPVAVLATMILFSYAKILSAIIASVSVLYGQPVYGSRNLDITSPILTEQIATDEKLASTGMKAYSIFLILISVLIFFLGIVYTVLVFSWQWLLRYQDKAVFRWVKYQKLHHFLEPYHAPYTPKCRYWTGLLLLVRVLLSLISLLNFSLDPRVNLMSTIFVAGSLILT